MTTGSKITIKTTGIINKPSGMQHLHRQLVGLFLGAQEPFIAHLVAEHAQRFPDVAA